MISNKDEEVEFVEKFIFGFKKFYKQHKQFVLDG